MGTVVTLEALTRFKTNQDTANLAKFASLENGLVRADQLPSYVDDVIEGYFHTDLKFYKEAAHTTAITGETGKIYVDIGSTPAKTYRYSGSAYVEINSSVSQADRAMKDGDGNTISTTYVKNTDYASSATYGIVKTGTNIDVNSGVISVKDGSTSDKGVVQVGSNISVSNGTISLTSTNVTTALGYTPVNPADYATNADIDALFS